MDRKLNPRAIRRQRAYTIVELLVVISIFTFLFFTTSLGAFLWTHRAALDAEEAASGSIRATFAIQRLSADIRKSTVAASADGSLLTLRSPDGATVRYFLEDGQLIKERKSDELAHSTSILGGVTSFVARADPSNSALISISITTAQTPRIGRKRSRSYDFHVLSRISPSP